MRLMVVSGLWLIFLKERVFGIGDRDDVSWRRGLLS